MILRGNFLWQCVCGQKQTSSVPATRFDDETQALEVVCDSCGKVWRVSVWQPQSGLGSAESHTPR